MHLFIRKSYLSSVAYSPECRIAALGGLNAIESTGSELTGSEQSSCSELQPNALTFAVVTTEKCEAATH